MSGMQAEAKMDDSEQSGRLYRMLWRWHFYAGLFCIPFIIALAVTGSIYLFRPQIEDVIDAPLLKLERAGAPLSQQALVEKALEAQPGSKLAAVVLPEHPDQAARVLVSHEGVRTRVYLHPDSGAVLKSADEAKRFGRVVQRIHGELLLGQTGSILVELAASWAIVMVLTGLYLWWPRQARGLAGVLWPRVNEGKKRFWRDIHAVTGVWVSVFALFLLVTGLPWAQVWGAGLKQVRMWTSTTEQPIDWAISSADEHAEHMHAEHEQMQMDANALGLDAIVARARVLNLAPPVLVAPPTTKSPYWEVKSESANRPLRANVFLSPMTGEVTARRDFSGRHPIDQVVGVGVAAHEGQLFGWANQALGLLTAIGLVTLCVSAFVMWRQRAPGRARAGVLSAPPPIPDAKIGAGLGVLILVAALLLPVLGVCLAVLAAAEQVVLKRWPPARRWLGLHAT
jgi:uncharacterized iron-regulated membrane protein